MNAISLILRESPKNMYGQRCYFFDGEKIRQLREASGLSMHKLAREAGVSTCYLTQIENNRYGSRLEKVQRVIDAIIRNNTQPEMTEEQKRMRERYPS